MAERPAIDPRYDPAFQRGYDGAAARQADADPRRSAPHVTSALQRPAASPPSHARAAEPAHPAAASAYADDAAADADTLGRLDETDAAPAVVQVVAPAPRPPWTNPFVTLIAVIGVAVLGTGVWLLQSTIRLMEQEDAFTSQTDYWFMQWATIATPVVLALGVSVLVTVLVICAVYWGRRPPAE